MSTLARFLVGVARAFESDDVDGYIERQRHHLEALSQLEKEFVWTALKTMRRRSGM
jgi:hypothetical protein